MIKSIGQILKNARQKKNIPIEEVHKVIKINTRYLRALEIDDYSVFEGKVHAKGFLKLYADFLEVDIDEILALWRREYESLFEKKQNEKLNISRGLQPEKFVITPSIVLIITTIMLLSFFFLYLFFQYKKYTDAPILNIYYPQDNQVLAIDVLDITGSVELDCDVFINNQKIYINNDGNFLTSVKLREGINTISIKAINRLNKETEKVKTVIYRPEKEVINNTDIKQTTPSIKDNEIGEN